MVKLQLIVWQDDIYVFLVLYIIEFVKAALQNRQKMHREITNGSQAMTTTTQTTTIFENQ